MTAYMEYDLCGRYDNYAAQCINVTITLKWFHCCLACSLIKVSTIYYIITFCKFSFNIAYSFMIRYANITFIILTYRDMIKNIIFRVNYCFMINSSVHIKNRFLYFVLNLNQRHCFKSCSLIFCNNKSHFISYIANYRI